MVDLQEVIDEMRPMLADFLEALGLHTRGLPIQLDAVKKPLSDWIAGQAVSEDDIPFLTSRVTAFISQYLIDLRGAKLVIHGGAIQIQVPFEHGIVRLFDPFPLGLAVAQGQMSLEAVIANIA